MVSVARTGNLALQRVTINGGSEAIVEHGGVLAVRDSTLSGSLGYAIVTAGICVNNDYYQAGRVTIDNSVISGNGVGGILASYARRFTVQNSTISNNKGSGIDVGDCSVRIVNSTIAGNNGSGVRTYLDGAQIINSTITGNSGGGHSPDNDTPGKLGGGVYLGSDSAGKLINSTISGNSATLGGGVYVGGGQYSSASITNSTITGNSAQRAGGVYAGNLGDLTLAETIVSGNHARQGREIVASADPRPQRTAARFNLFVYSGNSGVVGISPGVPDIVPSQPVGAILSPQLASNGGATRTHALVAGSPAIDAVNDGTCP
ncbi:MAG TPA: right-handed parallel beta-helix repeat-containing protein, partial [Gammaproteobacteria bacterium]|nr:right-handed parallel beta-helix repeat-containing protein [Gammaproteobacteria bacterium]